MDSNTKGTNAKLTAVHLVLYLDSELGSAVCHLYCNSKYYHSSSEAHLEPCQISMIELF